MYIQAMEIIMPCTERLYQWMKELPVQLSFVLDGLMNRGINLMYNGVLVLNGLINGRGTCSPLNLCPGWVNELRN